MWEQRYSTRIQAKSLLDEGKLEPDDLVEEMLIERLMKKIVKMVQSLMLSKNTTSSKSLEEISNEFPVKKVLVFDVNEEELVQRIILRGETSGRSDDTAESIKVRQSL